MNFTITQLRKMAKSRKLYVYTEGYGWFVSRWSEFYKMQVPHKLGHAWDGASEKEILKLILGISE